VLSSSIEALRALRMKCLHREHDTLGSANKTVAFFDLQSSFDLRSSSFSLLGSSIRSSVLHLRASVFDLQPS
jgi:hypothetical protein